MNEVLSQDEIDQLLTAISTGDIETEEVSQAADQRKIKIYDFKRPDKFSKEQIRTVSIMHETFARLTTTALSAQLRSMVHVHVASVDQLTYEEFIRSIPNPTTLGIINMDPLKGSSVLEIDPAITFTIIDRLFGGKGEGAKVSRDLSDIEQSVMEGIIVRILGNLREAWSQVIDLRPRLGQIETNPQFAQIVPAHRDGSARYPRDEGRRGGGNDELLHPLPHDRTDHLEVVGAVHVLVGAKRRDDRKSQHPEGTNLDNRRAGRRRDRQHESDGARGSLAANG